MIILHSQQIKSQFSGTSLEKEIITGDVKGKGQRTIKTYRGKKTAVQRAYR